MRGLIPTQGDIFLPFVEVNTKNDAFEWISLQQDNFLRTLKKYSEEPTQYHTVPISEKSLITKYALVEWFEPPSTENSENTENTRSTGDKEDTFEFKVWALLRDNSPLLIYVKFGLTKTKSIFNPDKETIIVGSLLFVGWWHPLKGEHLKEYIEMIDFLRNPPRDLNYLEVKKKVRSVINSLHEENSIRFSWDSADHHIFDNSTWPFHIHFVERKSGVVRGFYNTPHKNLDNILQFLEETIPPVNID